MPGPLTTPILAELRPKGPDAFEELWDSLDHGDYFDREGYPISMREWTMLFEYKPYQVVEQTDVGGYQVSTIWLGINHNFLHNFFGKGLPVIFESMVFEAEVSYKKPSKYFPDGYWYQRDYEQIRYATEEAAQKGHWKLVEEVRLLSSIVPDLAPIDEE